MDSKNIEIYNDMEFLLKELHIEWDRSGAVKESVSISLDDVEDVHNAILFQIYKSQKAAEKDNITFKQSIRLSRECYVLLRLIRKIKTAEDWAYHNGSDNEFKVALDVDELKHFKEMFHGKVK